MDIIEKWHFFAGQDDSGSEFWMFPRISDIKSVKNRPEPHYFAIFAINSYTFVVRNKTIKTYSVSTDRQQVYAAKAA